MPGYTYGGINTSRFRLVGEGNNLYTMHVIDGSEMRRFVSFTSDLSGNSELVYRYFILGRNDDGSPTTNTGNNESHYTLLSKNTL